VGRDDILATLKLSETALRAQGVRHVALFGSVARGEETPDSDIDILVEFDPGARMTVYRYVRVKDLIAGLFDVPVDVVDIAGLKQHVRPDATASAHYAF
jgi:predicted nucleotidyltransferase